MSGFVDAKVLKDGTVKKDKLSDEVQETLENTVTKEEIYTVMGNPPRPYETNLHVGQDAYAVALGKDASCTAYGVALGYNSTFDWSNITEEESQTLLPVTVGNTTHQRRIINVKDGRLNTDAATVGQLNNIIVNGMGTATNKVMSQNAVSSSLYNDPSAGTKVQIGTLSSATGVGAVALGRTTTSSGTGSVAIGSTSSASASYAIAIGGNASVTLSSGIAIGYSAAISGNYSIAIGYQSSATVNYATVLGASASSEVLGGVALGYSSQVLSTDLLSSDPSPYAPVSLGRSSTTTGKRRIINLRNGVNSYDAVNLSQLNAARSVSIQLSSDLLELVELLTGSTIPIGVMATSADTVENPIHSKVAELKNRLQQQKEDLETFEQQQKEYYDSLQIAESEEKTPERE